MLPSSKIIGGLAPLPPLPPPPPPTFSYAYVQEQCEQGEGIIS